MLQWNGTVQDHLSNERTYLAWLRTSLSLASIGIGRSLFSESFSSLHRSPPSTSIQALLVQLLNFFLLYFTFDFPKAVTQLFRLTTIQSPSPSPSSSSSIVSVPSNLQLLEMHELLFEHMGTAAGVATGDEGQKYRYLGKPVGGVFLILALVFLILGTFL